MERFFKLTLNSRFLMCLGKFKAALYIAAWAISGTTSAQKPTERSAYEFGTTVYPEIISIQGRDTRVLDGIPTGIYGIKARPIGDTPEEKAKNYLKENWRLFGLTQEFEASCRLHATRKGPSGTIVRFRQIFDGLNVDKNEFTVKVNPSGEIVHVQNSTRPVPINLGTRAIIMPEAAANTARAHLQIESRDRFFSNELTIHFIGDSPCLAYKITIVNPDRLGEWELFVDAQKGNLLEAHNTALNTNGTGRVFNPDPISTSGVSYGTGGFVDNNDQNNADLEGQLVSVVLQDIEDSGGTFTLRGPWAAIVDSESPFKGLFTQNNPDFNFNRSQDGFEAVMCYYHIDQSMRYINGTLGIPLQPYQYSGGVRFDPHGLGGADNSHYISSTGEVAFGEGCVDDAEDADVIIHELGHGIHDWLTNGGISQNQGLSEGCGDYRGQSYSWGLGGASHDFFNWDGHNVCWAGRTTDHDVPYPPTGGIHTQGQLWATMLMKIYGDIEKEKTDRIFLEGLAMTNSVTNQKQAAEAVYQAAIDLGYSNQDLCKIYGHLNGKYTLSAPAPCCNPCECAPSNTHIYANTQWNTAMDMPGDIYIHSGAELVIEAKIGMRQGTRILVERNARLIINNGGVVTKGCDAPDWAGIQVLGNNQKIQPEHNAPLTDPDQAGIVWIDNGTVEWARTGVTAGGGYGAEFWGGVIWTDNNATFRNNRKDVEFMQYKFGLNLNKSRFTNTRFLAGLPTVPYANREGITIWETDGIEFDNCDIYSKGMQGIRTYDAGIKVHNGCDIESNNIGISSYATYPMSYKSVIGTTAAENNFYGNFYDVYASTATGWFGLYNPDGKFSMDVINNNFEGSRYGVALDGPSNFRIGGNKFVDVEISAWTANTGFNNVINQNLIGCNRIDALRNIGIFAIGDNKEMQLLGNDFIDGWTPARDFVLTNSFFPGNNGAIQALQGNPFAPADNCFSDPGAQIDIQTWGVTDFFTYYYESGEPPVDCDPEPLNPGNYGNDPVIGGIFTVDCDQFGGLPDGLESPTEGDLNTKRQQMQTLAPSIQTDANAKVQYYQILAEKEAILKYLVSEALEENDFATAEALLAGEQSKAAQWAIFGLRMGRQDYAGAAQLLNQMPIEDAIDAQFRDIQLINLQRLQNPIGFELSAAQEAYLNSMADGYSPIRGFARGILGLLKDRVYFPDEYDISEERSNPTGRVITEALKVYPVPASDQLVVTWPALEEGADAQIQIFDLLGRQHLSQPIGAKEINRVLGMANLPEGVYFLVIRDKGKVVHRAKFIVQH